MGMSVMNELSVLLVDNAPAVFTGLMTATAGIFGWILQRKKINIEDKTTSSMIEKTRIDSLISQIEMLSQELISTRHQITELHEQNIILMSQLREANKRISELEMSIERHNITN